MRNWWGWGSGVGMELLGMGFGDMASWLEKNENNHWLFYLYKFSSLG